MKRLGAALIVLSIFSVGALVSELQAVLIGNYKCVCDYCPSITQVCTGSGACTWCNSEEQMNLCQVAVGMQCESGANRDCGGVGYSGECKDGVCTGTNNPTSGCTWPSCD